jgi:hypothetical protein
MRYRIALFLSLCVGGLALFGLTSSQAQVCEPVQPQVALQYLRRLSLDLRGRLPSFEELERTAQVGKVEPEMIDKMVQSPELLEQVGAYHRHLLWANLANQRLSNNVWRLSVTSGIIRSSDNNRRIRYRGAVVNCLNEPAQYDNNGALLCKKANGSYESCEAMQIRRNRTTGEVGQEGFVMVRPYWAPSTEIKVCALEAQENETTVWNGQTFDCQTNAAYPGCGCGKGLRWCHNGNATELPIVNSLTEQMLRFAHDIVKMNRPYTEILLGSQVEVNGPISHYLRYQSQTSSVFASPNVDYVVPEIPFHEVDRWLPSRRSGLHAGVLTLPGFLLKFASNRGRANRFYESFLCESFQAPPGGLPAASDNCHNEPNLMKRCGCNFCHQAVEPAAAYWGRFAEGGFAPLTDLQQYPAVNEACTRTNASNNATCRRLYFINPGSQEEQRYRGHLLSYVFADAHPRGVQMAANIEQGPRLLANDAIQNGKFAACTTKKLWSWFIGTDILPQQQERVAQLAQFFKESNYNLLTLVKALVSSEEYRQGRLAK